MKTVRKNLNCDVKRIATAGQNTFKIHVCKDDLADWIAILWIVVEGLGTALITGARRSQFLLGLGARESRIDTSSSIPKISLNKVALVTLGAYLMRYYRDDVADVDHIDFDVASADGDGYLIVAVDESRPALSAEEAHHRLNS